MQRDRPHVPCTVTPGWIDHRSRRILGGMFPGTIRTTRLLLRQIEPGDAGAIFDSYAQDPEVTHFLTWRPHQSRSDTEAYISHCLRTPPDIARTYVHLVDGAVRGALDLRLAERHRVEFGYVLAREYWGFGLMAEVLSAVVVRMLKRASVFRIGSICDVENIASARVMEKAGLTREGLLHRWLVHPNVSDEPRDCFVYGRVR